VSQSENARNPVGNGSSCKIQGLFAPTYSKIAPELLGKLRYSLKTDAEGNLGVSCREKLTGKIAD
jgi:hypothetical protein